jgi:hypothetical protein
MTFEAGGSSSMAGGCSDEIDGATSTADANYRLSNTQEACAFIFKTGL